MTPSALAATVRIVLARAANHEHSRADGPELTGGSRLRDRPGPGQGVLNLQRTAGNRATAAFVADASAGSLQLQSAEGGGQLMVQRSVGSWFRKKLGMKPKISAPKSGHAMLPSESNGVPSARDLMDIMERGGALGSSLSDEDVQGVGDMFKKFEGENDIREGRRNRRNAQALGDEDMGVGGMMQDAEEQARAADQKKIDDDNALFDGIKKAAGDLRDPTKTAAGSQAAVDAAQKLVTDAIALWRQSPRRLLGLPEDRAKNLEIAALLQDLKWNTDKAKVDGAGLQPNPELKSEDKTGYFVSKTTPIYAVDGTGNLAASPSYFTNDATLKALTDLTKGGKEGYEIKIGPQSYWVEKAKVVIKHGSFDKVGGDLFAKDPTPEDVKQTTLGDCYLQAAIASMASQNPALIKAMMRDNGDDSVTVRLYKVDDTDSKNHKFDPQYLKLEKSIPKDAAGKEVYNAGALWVRMIEKAYAAGGFTGRSNKAAPATLSYEGIAAGQSRHALEILTGVQSGALMLNEGPRITTAGQFVNQGATNDIKGSTVNTPNTLVSLPWDAGEVGNHATAKAADNYDNLTSFKILKDKGKTDTWITFVKTDKLKAMFIQRETDRGKGFATQITLTDFDTLFKANLPSDVADPMLAWIEDQKLYPGELGTAKYSQSELDAFAKIKERLDAGGEVTGATQVYPSGTVTAGTGASGGEAVGKGMVGSHVYTILAYRASSGPDPADLTTAGKFYFLKVRNPWGNYGRKYDMSKGKDAGEEVKDGDGVSWLELSDLTKFFNQVHYN